MFVNRQKLKHKNKVIAVEAEKNKIAHLAKQQLEDFTKSIQEKNELLEQFKAEIEKYKALPCSNQIPEDESSLNALLNSVILTEDQWLSFQSLFDKVHTGYITRAKDKFKDLTAAELRFLVLSKLNLNYKEMAAIMGVSIDAARISKHRLLKKVQLPEGTDFESFVHSI